MHASKLSVKRKTKKLRRKWERAQENRRGQELRQRKYRMCAERRERAKNGTPLMRRQKERKSVAI